MRPKKERWVCVDCGHTLDSAARLPICSKCGSPRTWKASDLEANSDSNPEPERSNGISKTQKSHES